MKRLFLYIILMLGGTAYGQLITVKGTIIDINNIPIKDVNVQSINANYSLKTTTDADGYFQMAIPDSSSELTFSKDGYKDFSIKVVSNSNLSIVLEISELAKMTLEEILRAKVNTVSLRAEKITEAPGIVTVITGEELRNMGIRTLREVLLLIPGFHPFQNDDEQILAVRGVFATTSQKILLMRNGHSLNEGNLDIPQMEFSISIENIKKIEIIRGPGASIYGNSAFAAVVNIITRDDDEARVNTRVGNHGYFETDAYISKRINLESQFIAWGRYANIKGEKKDVVYDGGNNLGNTKGIYKTYSYPTNYDVGFRYSSNIMSTSLSARRHGYNTYWTIPGQFTNVDSLYWQPRLMQNSIHYDLTFTLKIDDNKQIHLQNYIDHSTLNNYRLIGNVTDTTPKGILQANEWNVVRSGMNYYGNWNYSNSGNFVLGFAYEYRKYLDSWVTSNRMNYLQMSLPQEFYPRSSESRFAGYMQAAHNINDWLRIDAGARYDFAEKYDATFNPRIAIILYPLTRLTVKTIYTKAFQAPGYSYRNANNNAAEFSGSLEVLKPEIINTYQWSARYDFNTSNFIEIAAYYNRLENMIARRPESAYYSNFGKLASHGTEIELNYKIMSHTIFANYALLLPDASYMDNDFKRLYIKNNKFRNLPQHTINSGIIFSMLQKLNFNVYTQYTSSYYASNDEKIAYKLLLNSMLRMTNFHKNIEMGISVYNVFDKEYKLGDPSIRPLPQPGRWYSISLTAKFDSF